MISLPQPAMGGLVVSNWLLGSGVSDFTPNGGSESAYFQTVQNPFQDTHTATLGNSYASAAYDFAWAGDSASFHITNQHHMAQLHGDASSSGFVIFEVGADSVLNANATYTFAFPSSIIGSTSINIRLYDITLDQTIYSLGQTGGNAGLGPPFGTLNQARSQGLLAGHQYSFSYSSRMLHFDPTPPGTFGTATADITITITPVPEPAGLVAAVGGLLLLRRRALA